MQGLLEPGLGRLASAGWGLSWVAVRRRLNTAADELATEGLFRAAGLARSGDVGPHIEEWWDEDRDPA